MHPAPVIASYTSQDTDCRRMPHRLSCLLPQGSGQWLPSDSENHCIRRCTALIRTPICYQWVFVSFCKLWSLLYALCSSDGKGSRWRRDQQLRSSSGPTLYREVSATQATDPWCNPSSPIALCTNSCNMLVAVSLSIRELVQTWDNGWEIHSSKDGATGEKGPATELKLKIHALSRSFSHELSVKERGRDVWCVI